MSQITGVSLNTLNDTVSEIISNDFGNEFTNTSNWITGTSNVISARITAQNTNFTNTSNWITGTSNVNSARLNNTSNWISVTSNVISDRLNTHDTTLADTSNWISDTSNVISDRLNAHDSNFTNTSNWITDTSNAISIRVNDHDTNFTNTSNWITGTSNVISNRITNLNADSIANGTTKKFIVNNTYDTNLLVTGMLTASNLNIIGTSTTINTTTYQTENMEILTSAIDAPALTITQSGTGLHDVMKATFNSSNSLLVLKSNGNMGIGITNPSQKLEVVGTVKSTTFSGSGSGLTGVNLSDKSTTDLGEGTNLYYTATRVGVITASSNVQTSNYVTNTSNVISDRLNNTSNWISSVKSYVDSSISIWNSDISTTTTYDISQVSFKNSINTAGEFFRIFDVSTRVVGDQSMNIIVYSLTMVAKYNSSKAFVSVSYMVNSSYFTLDTITNITNGISMNGNTIVFSGNNLVITPTTNYSISIISR